MSEDGKWRLSAFIRVTEAELRAEQATLRAELVDCTSPFCPHHWQAWDKLSQVCFLLGEPDPIEE